MVRRYHNQMPSVGETFESGNLRIDYASRTVTVNGGQVRLTPTEYSLLFHLSRSAGRVLPHQTLLAKVWGREYTDEIDYLKVYIRPACARSSKATRRPSAASSASAVSATNLLQRKHDPYLLYMFS